MANKENELNIFQRNLPQTVGIIFCGAVLAVRAEGSLSAGEFGQGVENRAEDVVEVIEDAAPFIPKAPPTL